MSETKIRYEDVLQARRTADQTTETFLKQEGWATDRTGCWKHGLQGSPNGVIFPNVELALRFHGAFLWRYL